MFFWKKIVVACSISIIGLAGCGHKEKNFEVHHKTNDYMKKVDNRTDRQNLQLHNPQNINSPNTHHSNNTQATIKSKIQSALLKAKPSDYVANEVMIKFKPTIGKAHRKELLKTMNIMSEKEMSTGAVWIKLSTKSNLIEMITQLNKSDEIEYAEPNYIPQLDGVPEEIRTLWGLHNSTHPGNDIDILSAWKKTKGNQSVIVAVIDSGIDTSHPDLKDNLWINRKEIPNNKIDDDGNGKIDDIQGWNFVQNNADVTDSGSHGTHVSGTIAAVENDRGVIGVAPKVKIMPLKVSGGPISATIEAIEYAVNNGADIINYSMGYPYYHANTEIAIRNSNILFVNSAGNGGYNLNTHEHYPTSYKELPNLISVANIKSDGSLSSSSNYGFNDVQFAAPGDKINSTILNGKYGQKSGTSMAAPHVAGIAALIKSQYPNYRYQEMKNTLLQTVTPLQSLQGKVSTGGIPNAGKAVGASADKEKPTAPTNLRSIETTTNTVDLTWNPSSDNVAVKEYQIFRDRDDNPIYTTPNIRFKDEGLKPDTNYTYTIRAVDTAGNVSNPSDRFTVKTQKEETEEEWSRTKTYTGGNKVTYRGLLYEAKYWTQGNQPDISDHWKLLSHVIPEWNPTKAYNAGDKVVYKGVHYIAKRWSVREDPETSSQRPYDKGWEVINS